MAEAENLKIDVSEDGMTVVAEGQIDSHTSPALDDALGVGPADATVSLELAGVSFIDSSGLRAIVRAHKRQLEAGGHLVIDSPSDSVIRLLEMTGLTSQLEISPSPAS